MTDVNPDALVETIKKNMAIIVGSVRDSSRRAIAPRGVIVLAPLPLFRLDAKIAADPGTNFREIRSVGWRSLLLVTQENGTRELLASVDLDETGAFIKSTEGESVVGLGYALEEAERELGSDCELRVLEIPDIFIISIWIHCDAALADDRFFVAEPRFNFGHRENQGSFFEKMRGAAQRSLAEFSGLI
jgi:hypothetical protein